MEICLSMLDKKKHTKTTETSVKESFPGLETSKKKKEKRKKDRNVNSKVHVWGEKKPLASFLETRHTVPGVGGTNRDSRVHTANTKSVLAEHSYLITVHTNLDSNPGNKSSGLHATYVHHSVLHMIYTLEVTLFTFYTSRYIMQPHTHTHTHLPFLQSCPFQSIALRLHRVV